MLTLRVTVVLEMRAVERTMLCKSSSVLNW
jgi:hypothetical protein